MKAVTKIFGDWKSSYETLSRYLNAMKISNLGTVAAHYFWALCICYGSVSSCILSFWTVYRRFPILLVIS